MNFFRIQQRHSDTGGHGSLWNRLDIGSTTISDAAWERGWNYTGSMSLKRLYDTSLIKSFEQKAIRGGSLSAEEVDHLVSLNPTDGLKKFEILEESDAKKIISDMGLSKHLELDGPISNVRLNRLIDRKRTSMRNNRMLSEAEGAQWWKGLGIEMGAAILDPLNLPFMFMAAFTRPAWLVSRLQNSSRLGANIKLSAGTGFMASAILEVPIATAARQEQLDYTALNSVINIAFGTTFSGVLGTFGHMTGMDARSLFRPTTRIERTAQGVDVPYNITVRRNEAGEIIPQPYRGPRDSISLKFIEYEKGRNWSENPFEGGLTSRELQFKIWKAGDDVENGRDVDVSKADEIIKVEKNNLTFADLDEILAVRSKQHKLLERYRRLKNKAERSDLTEKQKTILADEFARTEQALSDIKADLNTPAAQQALKLIDRIERHEVTVRDNQPGIEVNGRAQSLEKIFGDPAKLKSSQLQEYQVAVQKEKTKAKKIADSEKELIRVLTENQKSQQQIDEVLALFDPNGRYMATEGLAGRAQWLGDPRVEKAQKILEALRDLNDSSMAGNPPTKKQMNNDAASEEYKNLGDDPNAVAKEVEDLEAIAKGMDPEGYKSVKLQLDEIDATFKGTLDNDNVRSIYKRIINCKETLK